jgi:short-subunit dehydrogenase
MGKGKAAHAGQTVVVTGASGGIGRATATAFGVRGAHVGLVARGEQGLIGAARDVESVGGKACVIPADVSDPQQCEAAAERVEQVFGSIDVWVNVAFTSVLSLARVMGPPDCQGDGTTVARY